MGLDQRLAINHEDTTVWEHPFRKVNFLHRWVEQHCNEGNQTNVEEVVLNLEHIAGLVQTCNMVLVEPERAPELLPTEGRFFFGGTDYDEDYLNDVREVRDACDEILTQGAIHHSHGGKPFTVTYWSWW